MTAPVAASTMSSATPATSSPPGVEALGVFLATHDAPRLIAWYRALGVPLGDEGYCTVGGADPSKGSVFSIMPAARPLPGTPHEAIEEEPYGRRTVTLNLRVKGLDAVLAGLTARGDKVAGPKDYGYGRFAWVNDPDGNIVELWETGTTPGSE